MLQIKSDPDGAEKSLASLWRALTLQTERFEALLATHSDDSGDTDTAGAEKNARTLSVLVRAFESLCDLTAKAQAARAQVARTTDNATEADAGGPDIDALRRALAERLARLRDDGSCGSGAGET